MYLKPHRLFPIQLRRLFPISHVSNGPKSNPTIWFETWISIDIHYRFPMDINIMKYPYTFIYVFFDICRYLSTWNYMDMIRIYTVSFPSMVNRRCAATSKWRLCHHANMTPWRCKAARGSRQQKAAENGRAVDVGKPLMGISGWLIVI